MTEIRPYVRLDGNWTWRDGADGKILDLMDLLHGTFGLNFVVCFGGRYSELPLAYVCIKDPKWNDTFTKTGGNPYSGSYAFYGYDPGEALDEFWRALARGVTVYPDPGYDLRRTVSLSSDEGDGGRGFRIPPFSTVRELMMKLDIQGSWSDGR